MQSRKSRTSLTSQKKTDKTFRSEEEIQMPQDSTNSPVINKSVRDNKTLPSKNSDIHLSQVMMSSLAFKLLIFFYPFLFQND